MINVEEFVNYLRDINIDFFTGVPDSQLSSFVDYVEENCGNIIAANEGNALAIASGYNLSTGNVPLVYLQNSGLGNIVNPVTSLTHSEVYSIPIVYLVGWRGQPGIHDEPQHIKQGAITLDLLDMLDIEYAVITKETKFDELVDVFENNFVNQLNNGNSVAVVVSKGAFEDYKIKKDGKASRELFEYREELKQGHGNDFLTVGSMGHSSSIALGVALNNSNKKIFCFDGDGAILMHMGSLALIGSMKPNNFHHVMFNNSAHESVGGLPTIMSDIYIDEIVLACGYKKVYNASNVDELKSILPQFIEDNGPVFLNIDVNLESRKDLGRPTTTPIENKIEFTNKLRS